MKRFAPALTVTACFALSLAWSGCSKSEPPSAPATGSAPDQGSSPPADQAVELKLKWPVGQRYVYRMEIKQKGTTTVPSVSRPMKQEADIAQEYSISVLKEREPAGRELEMEYLATQMDVTMNGRSVVRFDSGGENLAAENDPIISTFLQFIGMKFKFLLGASNNVEKVEGLDELKTKILAKSPPQARSVMDSMFSEEMFKNMVDLGKGLPENAVRPGDTWSSQTESAAGPMGRMTIFMDYTFESWETRLDRRCARLNFTGTLASMTNNTANTPGVKMNLRQGTMSGTNWFDPQLGMLVDADIKQNLDLEVITTIPRLGDKGGGTQSLATLIDQTINLKLVELTPPAP